MVGFDDLPAASLTNPPLTTVMQDTRMAGEVLVDTLLKLVRDEPAKGQVMPTRLVVRRSCGAGSGTRNTNKPAITKLTPPIASA